MGILRLFGRFYLPLFVVLHKFCVVFKDKCYKGFKKYALKEFTIYRKNLRELVYI